jgi:nucleotide-binding universal stress UspA family protein
VLYRRHAPITHEGSSMSIRIILTPLFGDDADAAAAQAAFAVTRRFDAHVEGLFARIDPLDTIPIVGEGVSPSVMDDLTRAAQVEMDKRASAARAHFEAARTAAGVALAERPPAPGGTSARWSDITGRREEVIARKARVSDLVVFGAQPSDSPELGGAIETTLVAGGRPLLLAPKGVQTIGERVAIAWNDSAESARALASALPFVEAASAVHVLTAETWRTQFEVTEALADYLEWRGIVCERRSIVAEDAVGAALLRAASDAGADLLVMGGYGRSRLRELVLGGVTRHVLTHAQLPVLLAH